MFADTYVCSLPLITLILMNSSGCTWYNKNRDSSSSVCTYLWYRYERIIRDLLSKNQHSSLLQIWSFDGLLNLLGKIRKFQIHRTDKITLLDQFCNFELSHCIFLNRFYKSLNDANYASFCLRGHVCIYLVKICMLHSVP